MAIGSLLPQLGWIREEILMRKKTCFNLNLALLAEGGGSGFWCSSNHPELRSNTLT